MKTCLQVVEVVLGLLPRLPHRDVVPLPPHDVLFALEGFVWKVHKCRLNWIAISLKSSLIWLIMYPSPGSIFYWDRLKGWPQVWWIWLLLLVLPGFACSIHTTWGPPFRRALYKESADLYISINVKFTSFHSSSFHISNNWEPSDRHCLLAST